MSPSQPRLIAIAGPLQGEVYPLTELPFTIGRVAGNQLPVTDARLSRRHCQITCETNQWKLIDLASLNGTYVNDERAQECTLAHGDRLSLGESTFLFLLDADDTSPIAAEVTLSEEQSVTSSTILLRSEDSLYLQKGRLQAALPQNERLARELQTLLSLNTALSTAHSVNVLERRLLEVLAEAVPLQQGALLHVTEEAAEGFSSVFGWDKEQGVHGKVTVSRTLAQRVFDEGVAMLSNELPVNPSKSLLNSGVRSLLVVPLTVMERKLGVLWLATDNPQAFFDESHLQLVTAAAAVAAVALDNLRRLEWFATENQRLNAELSLNHNMIGESQRMKDIYQRIARVAPTDATVLIRGESGTGKELAARAIHQNSARADQPFIAINCAALTETLLESELFGHEKGAFTGAIAQKKGKLELAQGGTLFLDEMGEMAPLLQAKLLRVLQEREFERVGGTRTLKTAIRLIAATNRDLESAIRDGSFRQDLYYRLNVITLTMPPLRERRPDVPLLASYFATKYGEKCKRTIRGLTPAARGALMAYDWPGNVRELENALERAVVLGVGEWIQPEDLPEAVLETAAAQQQAGKAAEGGEVGDSLYHNTLQATKKQLILQAFAQAKGNYTETAKLLGVHPNYLHRLIRNLNLKAELQA